LKIGKCKLQNELALCPREIGNGGILSYVAMIAGYSTGSFDFAQDDRVEKD